MQLRLNSRIYRALRFGALLACGIIAAALMIEPAAGQSGLGSGRVEGTVMDESGSSVAEATVTARNDATALTTIQTSDPSGHFLFPYLSPGTYQVSVEKAGFKSSKKTITVPADGSVSLPQLCTSFLSSPQLTLQADKFCRLGKVHLVPPQA